MSESTEAMGDTRDGAADGSIAGALPCLAWQSLVQAVMASARPLQDWERKDADEFFWSEFEGRDEQAL